MRKHRRGREAASVRGGRRMGFDAAEPSRIEPDPCTESAEPTASSSDFSAHVAALVRSTEDYLHAEAAAVQEAALDTSQWILWKFALLGVGVAVIIIATVHVAEGLTLGLAQVLGGNAWLAHLLTGAAALLGFGIVAILLQRREGRWRQRRLLDQLRRCAARRAEASPASGQAPTEAAEAQCGNLQEAATAARENMRESLAELRADMAQSVDPRAWLPRGPQATFAVFCGAFMAVSRIFRRVLRRWRSFPDSAFLWAEMLKAHQRAAVAHAAGTNGRAGGRTRAAWDRLLATLGQTAVAIVLADAWRGPTGHRRNHRSGAGPASGSKQRRRRRR